MSRPLRRRLLQAAFFTLASPLAFAQAERVRRIGILVPAPASGPHNMDVFLQGLQELGYVQGRNLQVETRFGEGRDDRLPALAEELVRQNVELIVAAGPAATFAAKAATSTVPIVMGTVDPVEQGLVASLARPGGNVTGWCFLTVESARKQLAVLKEAMPRAARFGVIASPAAMTRVRRAGELSAGAGALGVSLALVELPGPDALEAAFATLRKESVDAFIVIPEPAIDRLGERIATLAMASRLPGMYSFRRFYVDSGGLMSYGPSLRAMIALWPSYVDKILKGAKPGELPVQTPTKYELVLNHRAAKAIGFTFPPSLVLAADAVIN